MQIPGGYFQMGHPGNDSVPARFAPQHEVFVSTFTVAVNLTTVEDFIRFLNRTKYPLEEAFFSIPNYSNKIDLRYRAWIVNENGSIELFAGKGKWPITEITWVGANAYCEWLSANSEQYNYRLPTEAEWEYLASNGGKDRFPWGNKESNFLGDGPIEIKRIPLTCYPVGTKKKNQNKWGVYDLIGVYRQWCNDYYSMNTYLIESRIDPQGPSIEDAISRNYKKAPIIMRVCRGGGYWARPGALNFWLERSFLTRSYTRNLEWERTPIANYGNLGTSFRWVRENKQH